MKEAIYVLAGFVGLQFGALLALWHRFNDLERDIERLQAKEG
jgi:hypothetical protein